MGFEFIKLRHHWSCESPFKGGDLKFRSRQPKERGGLLKNLRERGLKGYGIAPQQVSDQGKEKKPASHFNWQKGKRERARDNGQRGML